MITLKNNAQSLLAASLSAGDTSLRVSLGDGALFPDIPVPGADWFRAALSDNAGNTEYIKVTGKDGDVLTVARGEEGSAAQAWTAGARIQVRMTAKTWEDMAQDHWTRLTAADGSIVIPTRLSDTALRVTGDWTKEAHARRALRVAGSDTLYYIAGSAFSNGTTTITLSDGVLPAHIPALDLGMHQAMMPVTHALSDAVDSVAQNVGASSQAVKTAYDAAVAARNAITLPDGASVVRQDGKLVAKNIDLGNGNTATGLGQVGLEVPEISEWIRGLRDLNLITYNLSGWAGNAGLTEGIVNWPPQDGGGFFRSVFLHPGWGDQEMTFAAHTVYRRSLHDGAWSAWAKINAATADNATHAVNADHAAAADSATNAVSATYAAYANTLRQSGSGGAMVFHWSGQGGQPTWLWGSNDGTNHYVYNPANFSVSYAATAGRTSNCVTNCNCCSGYNG